MVTITIRDVDENTWRRFKSKAAAVDLSLGKALGFAIDSWSVRPHKKGKGFFDLDPIHIEGGERLSEEIDEIVYS